MAVSGNNLAWAWGNEGHEIVAMIAASSTRLVFCTFPGFTRRIAPYRPFPAATASQAVRLILASAHASGGLCPAGSKGLV